MSLAAAYMFGVKKEVDPLQALRDLCVFAFNADTSGYVGNNYAPEVGSGNLVRVQASQTTGIVNQGLNVNANKNNALDGNSILNANANLQMTSNGNDVSFFISFWIKRTSLINRDFHVVDALGINLSGGFTTAFNSLNNNPEFSFQHYGINSQNNAGAQFKHTVRLPLNSILPLNEWKHYVMSYDASNLSIEFYIDSLPVNTSFVTNTGYLRKNLQTSAKLAIGKLGGNYQAGSTSGHLDAINIFRNSKASQSDANLLYNNGNGVQLF
jgi:hypothetical protein